MFDLHAVASIVGCSYDLVLIDKMCFAYPLDFFRLWPNCKLLLQIYSCLAFPFFFRNANLNLIVFSIDKNNHRKYNGRKRIDWMCAAWFQDTGVTTLMVAARESRLVIAERLLDAGNDVALQDKVIHS